MKSSFLEKERVIIFYCILLIGVIFVVFNQEYVLAENQQEMTCPYEEQVPVGQMCDQTAFTSDKIMTILRSMISAANQEYQAGQKLARLAGECKVENCQSVCTPNFERTACNNDCAPGYSCSSIAGAISHGDGSKKRDCSDLSALTLDSSKWYAEYDWEKTVPCVGTCATGTCYLEACEEQTCDKEKCSGDACPFGQIDAQNNNVAIASGQVNNGYQGLIDIFTNPVTSLPLLGEICKFPVFNLLCGPLKTESEVLVDLLDQSLTNLRACQTSTFELEKAMTVGGGNILLPCEVVSPNPVEECHLVNYFCCH